MTELKVHIDGASIRVYDGKGNSLFGPMKSGAKAVQINCRDQGVECLIVSEEGKKLDLSTGRDNATKASQQDWTEVFGQRE